METNNFNKNSIAQTKELVKKHFRYLLQDGTCEVWVNDYFAICRRKLTRIVKRKFSVNPNRLRLVI